MLLLVACGGDEQGNDDTLFTGLSGVIILGLAIFFIMRAMKRRG